MLEDIPKKTEQQRNNERRMLEALVNAGWQRTQRSRAFDLADLRYHNARGIELEYHYFWQDDSVNLKIRSSQGLLYLVIDIAECLETFIEALVRIQDMISPHAYQEAVRQLLLVCPSVFVNTGEELVPVVLE